MLPAAVHLEYSLLVPMCYVYRMNTNVSVIDSELNN